MKVGVWFIGALGDVATTTVLGARAIARGLAPTTGLVSETLQGLDLVALGDLVFGGHDVREASPVEAAKDLAEVGVVPHRLAEDAALQGDLAAFGERVRPGVTFGATRVVRRMESEASRERTRTTPAGALAGLRADLRAFREANQLDRVVVVAVASTEPLVELSTDALATEAGIRGLLADPDRGADVPASLIYALAAFDEGCAYVNFTPSVGATPKGMQEAALRAGVPHMGNDGKTGQTLVRTTLAPMFRARNLNVLSWSGFNILGNRDGAVLEDPGANLAKTVGKDKVLSSILGPSLGTSLTRIDYVPSLQDWKTAWDFIHFEGFLGTKMCLELTWRGADSALAAPLVLDLVRLIELAARRKRAGLQAGLAPFFKAPLGVAEQAFPAQCELLARWVDELQGSPRERL
jgi:myo-inositol-1-phosphate synthase